MKVHFKVWLDCIVFSSLQVQNCVSVCSQVDQVVQESEELRGRTQIAMSRHRNVRTMNYDDDYEGYYDVYGRSQEEDSCISPNTEEQFLYNREKLHSMSSFLSPGVVEEEEEGEEEVDVVSALSPLDQGEHRWWMSLGHVFLQPVDDGDKLPSTWDVNLVRRTFSLTC